MSSAKRKTFKNIAFVNRLVEICGTNEAAHLQRLLNISYQAAKNYLTGRYPNTEILLIISERTGCSIHWLLTGEGKKLIRDPYPENTPIPADQTDALVRRICVEVINERFGSEEQPKVVVLPSERLHEESVSDVPTHSKRD
jgi:hypothetical protein